jgi:ABC-type polysaccharide/polyol phosphate transport system ATPase subunit
MLLSRQQARKSAMSSAPLIRTQGVSKCYQIYAHPRDRLKQALWPRLYRGLRLARPQGPPVFYREFWALNDVSLDVRAGETVGIVGRNGSGKSTLLQLICGTVAPTAGSIDVCGRVAALLELGAGFNMEFTGRENVYMNAAILGLSRDEIENRFDDIARFAEIGEFLERPVRMYSSGMLVRLAFAVAVNVEADILIIDEALAVGDARFQLKCFRMLEFLQQQGKALLFVSHDAGAIKRLCSRTILLEQGRMLVEGAPNDVLNIYSKLISDCGGVEAVQGDIERLRCRTAAAVKVRNALPADAQPVPEFHLSALIANEKAAGQLHAEEYAYGGSRGRIEQVLVCGEDDQPRLSFTTGEKMKVQLCLRAVSAIQEPIYALSIKDVRGQEIYGTNTLFQGMATAPVQPGQQRLVTFIQQLNLMAGTYFVSAGWVCFAGAELQVIHRRYDVVKFEVLPTDRSFGIANCFSRISVANLLPT